MNMEGWIVCLMLSMLLTMIQSCSEELSLTDESLHIHSPGYDKGRNYDVNLHCLWNIKSSSKVFVNFTDFNVEYHFECGWDFVKVYAGQCGDKNSKKFCGTTAPSSFIHNGSICIEFVSDFVVTRPGFEVVIKAQKDSSDLHNDMHTTSAESIISTTLTEIDTMSDYISDGETTLINPTSVADVSISTMPTSNSDTEHEMTYIHFITSITTTTELPITTSKIVIEPTRVSATINDSIVLKTLAGHTMIDNGVSASQTFYQTISDDHNSITVDSTANDHSPLDSINIILTDTSGIHYKAANKNSLITKPATAIATLGTTISSDRTLMESIQHNGDSFIIKPSTPIHLTGNVAFSSGVTSPFHCGKADVRNCQLRTSQDGGRWTRFAYYPANFIIRNNPRIFQRDNVRTVSNVRHLGIYVTGSYGHQLSHSAFDPSKTYNAIITPSSIETFPITLENLSKFKSTQSPSNKTVNDFNESSYTAFDHSIMSSHYYTHGNNNSIITNLEYYHIMETDSFVTTGTKTYSKTVSNIRATPRTRQFQLTPLITSERNGDEDTLKTIPITNSSTEIELLFLSKNNTLTSLTNLQTFSKADSSKWNKDHLDTQTDFLSEDVIFSTTAFDLKQTSASYVMPDKTVGISYNLYSTGDKHDDFTTINSIQDSSFRMLLRDEIGYLSDYTDYITMDFSSLPVIDASKVQLTETHHRNIMSENFLDNINSSSIDNKTEIDINPNDSVIINQSESVKSTEYDISSVHNVQGTLMPSFQTSSEKIATTLPPKSNFIKSSTRSLYDSLSGHSTKDSSVVFSTTSMQATSSSVITTLIEDASSTVDLPVACHITEQLLLNDSGLITIYIPYQGNNMTCTWLLLAKSTKVINLIITYNNTNIAKDCVKNRLDVYDGANGQHLEQLCANSTQQVTSTGANLLLDLLSTRFSVSIVAIYNTTKIDQCEDNYSLCNDSACLPSEWWCDNEIDCPNGRDEQLCGLCNSDEYRCSNGECINTILKCNGRDDCIDASDERDCATLTNQILRMRYGSLLLPVCGDNWDNSLADSICKYMSYELFLNLTITASNHNVSISIQYDHANNRTIKFWRPITTCQTEVFLRCSKEECGKRSSNLIVPYIIGGSQSYRGQWPWVVGIRVDGNFVCGGTLISSTWVVTAGHCLHNVITLPHVLSVVLGTTFKDGRNGTVLHVAEIIMHPDFDSIYNADIALLRLKKPAVFTDFTHNICLPTPGYILPRNIVCHIAGWGSTNPSDKSLDNFPDSLHHGKVNIWSNTKCNRVYSSEIKDNMICAGLLGGGVDTCQGDSGGPLMCSEDHKSWQLVGVTSWGNSVCGAAKSPGVYTRITSYSSWIWFTLEQEGYQTSQKCDFEASGICGFQDLSNGLFSWTKRTGGWTFGGQPLIDNTLQSDEGHYMYADTYLVSGTESSNAALQLQFNETSKRKCLSFAYHFYGNHKLTLQVQGTIDNMTTVLWTLSIISASWQTTEAEIPSGTTQLAIIAIRKSYTGNGGVAIDDIMLADDRCIDILSLGCDFDNGHACGYSNYSDDTDHWVLQNTVSLTEKDWYLKYSGNSRSADGKARLMSPTMQPRGPKCFTFRYKMCMPYANSLSILLGFVFNDVKFFGSTLWARSTSDDNCSAWTKGSANIPFIPVEHFIAVQVDRKFLNNDVYLDNLAFYNGNCIT